MLILSRREGRWEKLALVCVFAVVFFGFWTINTPYFRHLDEWYRAAHIQYVLDHGEIDLSHQYLQYFAFPGIQLLGSAICDVTGLSILEMRTVLILFMALILAALLYALFLKSLKNPDISALAVILLMLGSIMLSKNGILFSAHLAYIFIVVSLLVLSRREYRLWQYAALMIILILAITITHLLSSVLLILVLLGIYLVQRRDKKDPVASGGLVAISLFFVLAWEMFLAIRVFGELAISSSCLFYGELDLSGLFMGAGTAVGISGGGVPIWALIDKLFWWAFVYGFGTILGVMSLFRINRLNVVEKTVAGGLAGVIMLAIVATFAGAQGHQGAQKYLMFAPLFTVPFILLFFLNLGDYKRRYSIALLAVLLFALSLPTFFVNNDMIQMDVAYPSEISSREFLRSNYGEGEKLIVFSTVFSVPFNMYYLPEAELITDPEYLYLPYDEYLWIEMDELVTDFEVARESRHNVFIYSKRLTGGMSTYLALSPHTMNGLN